MALRTEIEIRKKQSDLNQKVTYLNDFLSSCYKGSDAKEKVEKELLSMRRELNLLSWILDDDLPF